MLPLGVIALIAAASIVADGCGGDGGSGESAIVYEAKTVDGATNVYTIDADGTNTKQLTTGTSFDGHPGWSPDGKSIIFVSDRDDMLGRQDVYLIDADGGNPRALTSTRGIGEWAPKFSHDGKQITYVEVGAGGDSYLMLMNADGSDPRRIAGPYRFAEFPSWAHDGSDEVYFAAIEQGRQDIDIYAVDLATEEVRTVISTPSSDVCPHFSHDGKYLTYATGAPDEEGNMELYQHDLTSSDTSGAGDVRLTTAPEIDDYLSPSPDGKLSVFLSGRDGNVELYLMNPDGTGQRRLTNTPDVRENVPDWGAHGS